MSGRRAPVERLVDFAVAIPLSVAVAARQLVPFGVTRLERRIARDLTLLQRYAGRSTAPAAPPEPAAPAAPASSASVPVDVESSTPRAVVHAEPAGQVADAAPVVDLPIEGYDQLSARQIVDRLASLTAEELAVVEAHERSRRRRQTVLARIAQLT